VCSLRLEREKRHRNRKEEKKVSPKNFFNLKCAFEEQQTFHSGELNLAVGVLVNLVLVAGEEREG